jgi:hypothetical protein
MLPIWQDRYDPLLCTQKSINVDVALTEKDGSHDEARIKQLFTLSHSEMWLLLIVNWNE